jgi:hypothetical protein
MSKILTAVGWLYYKYNHFPRSVRSEGFWRASNMFTMQNSGRDITDLLVLLGRYNCSDVRDKVFGCLRLYQSRNQTVQGFYGIPDALTPDYTKNSTRVLRDATRFCIGDDHSLLLLASAQYSHRNRPKGLPTWVPGWYRLPSPEDTVPYLMRLFNVSGYLRQTEILQYAEPNILPL